MKAKNYEDPYDLLEYTIGLEEDHEKLLNLMARMQYELRYCGNSLGKKYNIMELIRTGTEVLKFNGIEELD